jgi:hypothetical protein
MTICSYVLTHPYATWLEICDAITKRDGAPFDRYKDFKPARNYANAHPEDFYLDWDLKDVDDPDSVGYYIMREEEHALRRYQRLARHFRGTLRNFVALTDAFIQDSDKLHTIKLLNMKSSAQMLLFQLDVVLAPRIVRGEGEEGAV